MLLRTIANENLSHTYVFGSSKISLTQNKYNIRFGVSILQFYLALKNLVLWAKPVPHCGSQSSVALP